MTVAPRSRISRIRSQATRRAAGSSPWVSSSRNTTSGSFTKAKATKRRWRWPPEKLANDARSLPASPHCSKRARQSVRTCATAENRSSASHTLIRSGRADSWSWHPMRRRSSCDRRWGSRSSIRIRPPFGLAQPLKTFDGRCLAGAIRTEDAECFALLDLKGRVLDRHNRPVTLREVLDLEDERRHASPILPGIDWRTTRSGHEWAATPSRIGSNAVKTEIKVVRYLPGPWRDQIGEATLADADRNSSTAWPPSPGCDGPFDLGRRWGPRR